MTAVTPAATDVKYVNYCGFLSLLVSGVTGGQGAIKKILDIEVPCNFGLWNFFPPRAVTMGGYNVPAKTYCNPIGLTSDEISEILIQFQTSLAAQSVNIGLIKACE